MSATWIKLKPVLGLGLVLIFGMLLGGLLTWKFTTHGVVELGRMDPDIQAQFIVNRLGDELNLTSSQRTTILAIVLEQVRNRREIRRKIDPELDHIRLLVQQRIRAELSDNQQKTFDKLVEVHSPKLLFIGRQPYSDSSTDSSSLNK